MILMITLIMRITVKTLSEKSPLPQQINRRHHKQRQQRCRSDFFNFSAGPEILIPTGVLMPVANISMRVLMGITHA
jgi:hypothetical protein